MDDDDLDINNEFARAGYVGAEPGDGQALREHRTKTRARRRCAVARILGSFVRLLRRTFRRLSRREGDSMKVSARRVLVNAWRFRRRVGFLSPACRLFAALVAD